MVRCLCGDDAQTFIDVVDEVRSVFSPHRRVLLVEIDIGTFCRPGIRQARSFVTDPKEMSQIVVQDVRPLRTSSENLRSSHLL